MKPMQDPIKPSSLCLIIHGASDEITVDSREIAKEFGRRHDNVLQTIKTLIDDGKRQGSHSAGVYFANITKTVQNAVVQIEPKATQVRELMTAVQLKTLELAELMAAQKLTEGMAAGQPYKDIFQAIKTALNGFVGARKPLLDG
ncbi:MAG: Rha family transcriptional regulator [Gammaproteobacteria bacterium]